MVEVPSVSLGEVVEVEVGERGRLGVVMVDDMACFSGGGGGEILCGGESSGHFVRLAGGGGVFE